MVTPVVSQAVVATELQLAINHRFSLYRVSGTFTAACSLNKTTLLLEPILEHCAAVSIKAGNLFDFESLKPDKNLQQLFLENPTKLCLECVQRKQ